MFELERDTFEKAFHEHVDEFYRGDEKLQEACRYALEGQGKRIRPLLLLLSYQLFSQEWKRALPSAIAVEMVHTYSLVHDDLPLMDDDDLRRGRPTVHKKFDEATALLVGDALLSDAFAILAHTHAHSGIIVAMLRELSSAIGGRGMVLGQSLDLFWTAKAGYSYEDLLSIHQNKTGKLFAASCALGALAAGADGKDVSALREFGLELGLVFQILDDLLDEQEGTGKSAGKDRESGKLTFLTLMDRVSAQERVRDLRISIEKKLLHFQNSENLKKLLSILAPA